MRILSIFLALWSCACFSEAPFVLGNRYSGAWYDADKPGQGLLLEEISSQDSSEVILTAYLFSYDSAGRPTFLVGQGTMNNDSAILDVVATSGGRLGEDLDPSQISTSPWGTFELNFSGCDQAEFLYDGPTPAESGSLNLVPLAEGIGLTRTTVPCPFKQIVPEPEVAIEICTESRGIGRFCNNTMLPVGISTSDVFVTNGAFGQPFKIADVRIEPLNANITISNLRVVDSVPETNAYIAGLSAGPLAIGEAVNFTLLTESTLGLGETLLFAFDIDGTSISFAYEITLATD